MDSVQPTRNLGLCNECRARVPAEFFVRDGQTWIRKQCPTHGQTESLVSTDAKVWQAKRDLWNYVPTDPVACHLNCDKCKVDHTPSMVFLDVTNRCNMNCPICIATIRDMGFDFNPPLDYFEKIFAHISKMNPSPMVELFGGEPTMRDDLIDIINIGRKYGLKPRVVTNGISLANEEYCKKLCDAGVRMRFAYDGDNPALYEHLRGSRVSLDKKLKALENLDKYSTRKHAIISCAAWDFNDKDIPGMLQYFHDHRDLISDVGIIPLTENWKEGEITVSRHTTLEDVEKMVQQSVVDKDVEFIPAGLSYAMRQSRLFFRENTRSEVLLLGGVHPNCESFTLLISDGKQYRSVGHYLKVPFSQLATEFVALCKKMEPTLSKLDRTKFFQKWKGRLYIIRTLRPLIMKSVDFHRVMGGNPVIGLVRILLQQLKHKLFGSKTHKRRRPRRVLRVAVLPFEEQHSVDAARMESCKAVFAFEDVDDGDKVKTIPACLWYPYRNAYLEKISKKRGVSKKRNKEEVTAVG